MTNFDPYDVLMQLNIRVKVLEKNFKELQNLQLEMSSLIKSQTDLIRHQQFENERIFKILVELKK